jgi:hypothetical protein
MIQDAKSEVENQVNKKISLMKEVLQILQESDFSQ